VPIADPVWLPLVVVPVPPVPVPVGEPVQLPLVVSPETPVPVSVPLVELLRALFELARSTAVGEAFIAPWLFWRAVERVEVPVVEPLCVPTPPVDVPEPVPLVAPLPDCASDGMALMSAAPASERIMNVVLMDKSLN
jgi:hypothetical protein